MMKKIIALLFLSIYSFAQTGKPQAIDNLATPLFKGITLRKQVTPVTPTLGLRLANVGDRLVTKDSLGVVKQYLISSDVSGVYAPLANPTFTGTVSLPSTTSIGSVSSTELGYIDGVTSNIQTQLNTKFDASNSVFESPLTFVQLTNPSTGAITNSVGIPQSSAFGSGYLSSTDWSTFNSKAGLSTDNIFTGANTFLTPIFANSTSTSSYSSITGTWSNTGNLGVFSFRYNTKVGASTVTWNPLRFDANGYVGVGTNPSVAFEVLGASKFNSAVDFAGAINVNSTFNIAGNPVTTNATRLNYLTSATGTTGTTSTNLVFSTSPTLVTPNLGTPSAVTLTNGTGLPVSTGISGLGSGIAAFLGTPSSANLATALTDETGTGNAVFSASPTITGTLTTSVIANTAGANLATSSGNVGIRTNAPISPLHVNGAGLFNGDLSVSKVDPNLNLVNTSTSTTLNIYGGAVAAYNFNSANGHWFGTQGAYRMKIMTSATSFLDNVGIGTESPNASSILDVTSTNKGVLVPRLTTSQINAISSPADGLIVYNTDLKTICFYDGGAALWKRVSHSNM